MNKCKLIQPVPVMGRVLPSGMVVDAPDTFKAKLVASGKAVWVEDVQAMTAGESPIQEGSSGESPAPVSMVRKRKPVRKKVR